MSETLLRTPLYDLHLELGDILVDFKQYNEAIAQFQKASQTDRLRAIGKAKLARCLVVKSLFDLADETIREIALDENDREFIEPLKEVLYDIATRFESERYYQKAGALYKQIFKVDASYRDVVEKVEKFTSN